MVTVESPEKSRMMQEIRLSGSLRAKQEASVSLRVDGLVTPTITTLTFLTCLLIILLETVNRSSIKLHHAH